MKRRAFITLLGGATAWPLAARAQEPGKLPTIGFLGASSAVAASRNVSAFLQGMHALGYINGRDFEIEYRWAEGYQERSPTLAEELVRLKVDLILTGVVQAAVASRDATKTIPIVCPLLADPIRSGLIKSDARPGGNVTGLLIFVEGLPAKQLELVLDLIPGAARIGLLVNSNNVNNVSQRREIETAVATMAVKIISVDIPTPEGLDLIFPALAREGVDAVIVLRDAMFFNERRRIAVSAVTLRLPVIYAIREHVDDGGLISYGINVPENFRRSADYVVKILKGANPGDLPVEFPTRLELIINLKAASMIGITIPPTLLARADEVIE
jgi:putative tryptophan/tyrosine transport system substrate-binding protein